MQNEPTKDEIALMAELEQQVGDEDQVKARIALARECAPLDEQRRLAEQIRGQQVLLRNLKSRYDVQTIARNELARQFDPEYIEQPSDQREGRRISPEERKRRDEARSKVFNWSKMDRDRNA